MVYGEIILSMTMQGPSGILIPLGIENFTDINTARMAYNYLSVLLLLLIASAVGVRGEAAHCIFIPVLGGVFMLFGWLKFANMANAIAMTVIAGILGIMIYMNETNREKNGVGGPGSKVLNIVLFLILFQVALGVLPSMGVFDPAATTTDKGFGQQFCPPGATCGSYSNVEVTTTYNDLGNQGGFWSDVVSLVTGTISAFISSIMFIGAMIINIVLTFTVVNTLVDGMWPGVSSTIPFMAMMGIMSVVFWACDLIFIMNAYLKLFPSEGSV